MSLFAVRSEEDVQKATLLLVVFGVGLAFYILPTFVAFVRGSPYTEAIAIINLFLGWTLLGWVGALVWACLPFRRSVMPPPVQYRRVRPLEQYGPARGPETPSWMDDLR